MTILQFPPRDQTDTPAQYEYKCECGSTTFSVVYEAGDPVSYAVCVECDAWHNVFTPDPE